MQIFKFYINYFKTLDALQKIIFDFYIQKNDSRDPALHEQHLHKARIALLSAMKKIRLGMAQTEHKNLEKFENLYEIVFSLNTLKLRIPDYTTFEVCETEFKKISDSLSELLQHFRNCLKNKNVTLDSTAKMLGKLSNTIDRLEELYRGTLQVIAKDPTLFLFFLQDLIALRDTLESLFLGLFNASSP